MLWQDILHGRQIHFQPSHFLLELVFSPKKPRCALNQTLLLYFKCYLYALYKGRDIQELLFTNTNLFIRIYVFQEDSIMSRFVLVFLPLLLAVSFLQERFEHSIIIMMTDFHSMVFILKMSTFHSSECFGLFIVSW